MKITKTTIAAWIVIALTPVALSLTTLYRVKTGYCAGAIHGSVWLLMALAICMTATGKPYDAIAACFSYLPVGYIYAKDPCQIRYSHGFPLEWLAPFFIVLMLIATYIGGAVLQFLFSRSENNPEK